MRVRKKILRMLFFPLLAVLLTQSASALLDGASSHYSGYTIFDDTLSNGKHASVAIEFAVFDQSGTGTQEFEDVFTGAGIDAPDISGFNNFIYAYKLYNYGSSEDDDLISYFAILGLDEQASGITGLGEFDDGTNGEQPYSSDFIGDDAVWQWSGLDEGFSFIQLGDRSWLLVYSSNYDWVKGEYELRGTEESDFPKSGDNGVPEPSVIALLGTGAAFLLRRKRRKLA